MLSTSMPVSYTHLEEGKQQALSRIPDIVVSDIMMPVMDGITLCRQLKEDVRTSHIPVILLTAKDSLQDKEEGYEVGADSYLTKPFSASLPVSYTHLDVYKRQPIGRSSIPLMMPSPFTSL